MATNSDLASHVPVSLVLIGAGKMGGAMLQGWLATGFPAARITVIDPHPSEALEALASSSGIQLNPGIATMQPPDVVVLGIKPQALAAVSSDIEPLVGPETLLLSILAGKQVGDLRRALPRSRAIVRAMPNLPASIGKGATGAFANAEAGAAGRQIANTLLSAVGLVEWVEREEQVDAVTAVSGSGPAYLFHLVECLAAAARDTGLEPGMADRLARQTVIGAAELLATSGLEPDLLRRNVTSPGGTTEAALHVLMGEAGLEPLMRATVFAAKRRAEQLSG